MLIRLLSEFLSWLCSFGFCPDCKIELEPTPWYTVICPKCGYDAHMGRRPF